MPRLVFQQTGRGFLLVSYEARSPVLVTASLSGFKRSRQYASGGLQFSRLPRAPANNLLRGGFDSIAPHPPFAVLPGGLLDCAQQTLRAAKINRAFFVRGLSSQVLIMVLRSGQAASGMAPPSGETHGYAKRQFQIWGIFSSGTGGLSPGQSLESGCQRHPASTVR